MRKIIAFIIIVSIVMTAGVASAAPSTWFTTEVDLARQLGLVPGSLLTNYQADITREEFSEMVINLYEELSGKIAVSSSVNPFTDTSNLEVLKANNLGIVLGKGGGIFSPKERITREQIATMYFRTLYAVDPQLVSEGFTLGFADKSLVSSWASKEVAFMTAKGVIKGVGGNKFDPKGLTTREMAIALTVRTYQQFAGNVLITKGEKLTSEQIGALSDSVVQIFVEQYDGTFNTGSAFFYDKGRLATNFHVIENAKSITMEYEDGTKYTGGFAVTGYDREIDIATLMVSDLSTPPLKLGDSSSVVKGQRVYAIGSPVGLTNSLSDGLVSAVRNDLIQVTTAINPGNSGGALLDEYGRVIGITFARISDGDNLGFAIPINLLKSMSKDRALSIKQFNDEINLSNDDDSMEMSNYEIIDHLFDNMKSIEANGVVINFDGYDVVKKTDTLTKIYAYIDDQNLDKFLASEKAGIINIAKILKVHAVFYEEIIGTNVSIEVVYYGVYDEYPKFFEENYLSEDTISYYGIWEVLYPLIEVYNNSNQFSSWYGSHTL